MVEAEGSDQNLFESNNSLSNKFDKLRKIVAGGSAALGLVSAMATFDAASDVTSEKFKVAAGTTLTLFITSGLVKESKKVLENTQMTISETNPTESITPTGNITFEMGANIENSIHPNL